MPLFTEAARFAQFVWTVVSQLHPGKPKWTADHLPDLSGKVFIVTGGNTGIGRGTVKGLLLKNAKVYIATRSKERADRAIADLREETGKEALFLQVDLADLSSIKKATEEFKQRESQLDVLILNAGVLFPSPDALTAQGYDATLGVNIVGHFLFHRLLYPLLSASGRESDPSRIIWLSSMASYKPHAITYDAFREGPVRRRMDPFDLYSESKVGAVMLSTYLAKTCAADNVASIAVDPGYIKSEIYRSSPWYLKLFDWFLNFPVEYGAIGSLYAGAAPEGAGLNGKYLHPWAQVAPPSPFSLDGKEQEKLWTWLDDQVQAYL